MGTDNIRNSENKAEDKPLRKADGKVVVEGKVKDTTSVPAPHAADASVDDTSQQARNTDQPPNGTKQRETQAPLSDVKSEDNANLDSQTSVSQATEADDDPFDFGGLPDRNLKKNLGCGG